MRSLLIISFLAKSFFASINVNAQATLLPAPVPMPRLSLHFNAGQSQSYSRSKLLYGSGEPEFRPGQETFSRFFWATALQYNFKPGLFLGLGFKSLELGSVSTASGWRDSLDRQIPLVYAAQGKRLGVINSYLGYRLAFGRLDFSPRLGLDYLPRPGLAGVSQATASGVAIQMQTRTLMKAVALFNIGSTLGYNFSFSRNTFVRIGYDFQLGWGNRDFWATRITFSESNRTQVTESRNQGRYIIHSVSATFPIVRSAPVQTKPPLAD